jgi:hypothetical protein
LRVKTFTNNPYGIPFEKWFPVLLNFVARRQPEIGYPKLELIQLKIPIAVFDELKKIQGRWF